MWPLRSRDPSALGPTRGVKMQTVISQTSIMHAARRQQLSVVSSAARRQSASAARCGPCGLSTKISQLIAVWTMWTSPQKSALRCALASQPVRVWTMWTICFCMVHTVHKRKARGFDVRGFVDNVDNVDTPVFIGGRTRRTSPTRIPLYIYTVYVISS